MDPDKILSKETMMKPYRTIMDGRENEERMMILQKTIKNAIIDEIKSADDRTWSMVTRRRFELRSEAPKATIHVLGSHTISRLVVVMLAMLLRVLCWALSIGSCLGWMCIVLRVCLLGSMGLCRRER